MVKVALIGKGQDTLWRAYDWVMYNAETTREWLDRQHVPYEHIPIENINHEGLSGCEIFRLGGGSVFALKEI